MPRLDGSEPEVTRRKPILGILSIVIAAASMLPMLGILSLLGIVTGIIGWFRERHVTDILGTVISAISLVISPTVWALLASLWLSVYCMISDCGAIIANGVEKTLEKPHVQAAIADVVQATSNTKSDTSSNMSAFSNGMASVRYPEEWSKYKTDEPMPEGVHSVFLNIQRFGKFRMIPGSKVAIAHAMVANDHNLPLEGFVTSYIETYIKPKHPGIVVTPMQPVTLQNTGAGSINLAHLYVLTGSNYGYEEAFAVFDGGETNLIVLISAPTHDEILAAWPAYSDLLMNRINFRTAAVPAASADAPATVSP